MNQTTPELTWLFTAHFADGSVIAQDQADASVTRLGGSTFTDVRAYPSPLVRFELHRVGIYSHASVDLVTGRFTVNGTRFDAHRRGIEPHDLTLVYERLVRVEFPSGRHYVHRYYLGWECEGERVTIGVGG